MPQSATPAVESIAAAPLSCRGLTGTCRELLKLVAEVSDGGPIRAEITRWRHPGSGRGGDRGGDDRVHRDRRVGGRCGIEVLHWIRDTLYREDHSRIRCHNGPRVMASLRNLAIGAIRLTGRIDITEATRWACRNMTRPFTILGIT